MINDNVDVVPTGTIDLLYGLVFGDMVDPVGNAIVWVILVLTVIGLIDWIVAVIRLFHQRIKLELARRKLDDDGKKCPTRTPSEVLDFFALRSRSPLGQRITRVVRLRSAGIGHRDILHQLTADRVEALGSIARYVGSTVILLGLLGTVYGLFGAVTGIGLSMQKEFDLSAIRELYTALTDTLDGMATAFGTTLAGLIAAVLLLPLNQLLRRFQTGVTSEVEDFVLCDFLPALETVDPDAAAATSVFAQTIATAATELEAVKTTVSTAASTLDSASGTLSGGAAVFKESLDALSDDQKKFTLAIEAADASIKDMHQATKQQATLLNDRLDKLEAKDNELSEKTRSLEALIAQFETTTKSVQTQAETTALSMADKFEEKATQLNTQAIETQTKFADEAREKIVKSLDSLITQSGETVANFVDSSQSDITAVLTQQSQVLEELKGLRADSRADLDSLITSVQTNLSNLTNANIGEVKELLKQQREMLEVHRDMIVDLRNMTRADS